MKVFKRIVSFVLAITILFVGAPMVLAAGDGVATFKGNQFTYSYSRVNGLNSFKGTALQGIPQNHFTFDATAFTNLFTDDFTGTVCAPFTVSESGDYKIYGRIRVTSLSLLAPGTSGLIMDIGISTDTAPVFELSYRGEGEDYYVASLQSGVNYYLHYKIRTGATQPVSIWKYDGLCSIDWVGASQAPENVPHANPAMLIPWKYENGYKYYQFSELYGQQAREKVAELNETFIEFPFNTSLYLAPETATYEYFLSVYNAAGINSAGALWAHFDMGYYHTYPKFTFQTSSSSLIKTASVINGATYNPPVEYLLVSTNYSQGTPLTAFSSLRYDHYNPNGYPAILRVTFRLYLRQSNVTPPDYLQAATGSTYHYDLAFVDIENNVTNITYNTQQFINTANSTVVFPIDASGTLVTMQYDSSMYLFDAGAFMADNSVTGESVSIYYGDASVLIYYVDPYGVSHTYMYAYQGVGDDGISGDGVTDGNGETPGPSPGVDLDDFFSRLDAWYRPYFDDYLFALQRTEFDYYFFMGEMYMYLEMLYYPYFSQYMEALGNIGNIGGGSGGSGGNDEPGIIGKVANWVAERLGNRLQTGWL